MPSATKAQFLHDYYDQFISPNHPDEFEKFEGLVAQQAQQDPDLYSRMAQELSQGYGQEKPPEPFVSNRLKAEYFGAILEPKFGPDSFDQFSAILDSQLPERPNLPRRMADELYPFVRHRMTREEFYSEYLGPDREAWTGPLDVLSEGWQTFAQQVGKGNIESTGDSLYVLGKYFGSDDVAQAGTGINEWAQGIDFGRQAQVPDWRQIEKPGDFFLWLAGLGGQGLGTIAPVLAGFSAGGAVGGPIGAIIGGATPSALLNIGESYRSFLAEGLSEEQAIEAAVLTAPAVVALDYVGASKLLDKSALADPVKSAMRRVYEGMVKGGLREGFTETGQDTIRQAVAAGYTGNVDAQRRAGDLVNSFAGGLLVGGGVGGARAAFERQTMPGETGEAAGAQGQTPPAPETPPEPEERYDPEEEAVLQDTERHGREEAAQAREPRPVPTRTDVVEPLPDELAPAAVTPTTTPREGTDRLEPPMLADENYVPSMDSYILAAEANRGHRRPVTDEEVRPGTAVVLDVAGVAAPVSGEINMVEQDGTYVIADEAGQEVARVTPEERAQDSVRLYTPTQEEQQAKIEAQPLPAAARQQPKQLLGVVKNQLKAKPAPEPKEQAYREEMVRLIERYETAVQEGRPVERIIPQLTKMRNSAQFQTLTRRQRDAVDTFLEDHEEQAAKALPAPAAETKPAPQAAVEAKTETEPEPETKSAPVAETPPSAQVQPETTPEPEPAQKIATTPVAPQKRPKLKFNPSGRDTVVTPAGTEHDVEYAVVEMEDLIASNTAEGTVNPDYPQELQPRDRTRLSSQADIQRIAANLNTRFLGESPTADTGAPIVDPFGIVESGNARTIALRLAYKHETEGRDTGVIRRYRQWLTDQGYTVEGLKQPVLVRIRRSELTPAQLEQFTKEANEPNVTAMSTTERALSDAKRVTVGTLERYEGGSYDLKKNQPFVHGFITDAVPKSEAGTFVTSEGEITAEGVQRLEAAMLAAAYDDKKLIERIAESQDQGRKTIRNILVEIAPTWALMKKRVEAGTLTPDVDQTQALMDAVSMMDKSVRKGTALASMLGQSSMFGDVDAELEGQRGEMTRAFLSAFYQQEPGKEPTWRRLNAQSKVAEAFRGYLNDIVNFDPRQTNMFGEPEKPPTLAILLKNIARVQNEPDSETEAQRVADVSQVSADPAAVEAIRRIADRILPENIGLHFPNEQDERFSGVLGLYERHGVYPDSGKIGPLVNVTLSGNPLATIHHETMHALLDNGFLTQAEWDLLKKEASEKNWMTRHNIDTKYADSSEEVKIAESIAEEFGIWAAKRHKRITGSLLRIFDRIRDVLFRIARTLRFLGYATTDAIQAFQATHIFHQIRSGAVKATRVPGERISLSKPNVAYRRGEESKPFVKWPEKHEKPYAESHLTKEGQKQNQKSLKELAKEWLRQYRYLPEEREYADLIMKLRPVKESLHNSAETVTEMMNKVVKDLSPDELEWLGKAIFLPDIRWTMQQGMKTPFEFETIAEVDAADVILQENLKNHPVIAERLKIRNDFMDQLRKDLVEHGVLPPERLANKSFVHHQVIQYAMLRGVGGMRTKLAEPVYTRRRGSELNINTNYVMVEMEYLFKALNDIEVSKFLKWLKKSKFNKMPELQARAKKNNDEKLTAKLKVDGMRSFALVAAARQMAEEEFAKAHTPNSVAKAYAKVKKQFADDLGEASAHSPMMAEFIKFRQQIAMNMAQLQKRMRQFSQWQIDQIPNRMQAAFESFVREGHTAELIIRDKTDANIFSLFNLFLHSPVFEDVQDVVTPLMAAIAHRRKWIKETALKEEYVNPNSAKDLIEAYGEELGGNLRAWQANAKDKGARAMHLFSNNTVPAHIIEGMLDQISTEIEAGDLTLLGNKAVSRRLAGLIRQYKQDDPVIQIPMEEMILDEPVAETLNNFRDKRTEELFQRIVLTTTGLLKRTLLFMPHRFIPYVTENQWGDLDIMIASLVHGKGIASHVRQARQEVYANQVSRQAPAESLAYAKRMGITQGGQTMQEIDYLKNAQHHDFTTIELTTPGQKNAIKRMTDKYLDVVMGAARLRENMFRYAAFLHFQEQLVTQNKSLEEVGYGASNPEILKGITDKRELAVRMAADFMGDYGGISQIGRRMRQTIYPFWSFPETNATRYYWLFQNAGGPNGSAAAALAGALLIFKGHVAMHVWNNLFFGDQEDDYTWAQRMRPHLNLGKWGGEYRKVDGMGSLMEAFKWIGMGPENIARAIGDYEGRDNLEVFWDVVLAPAYHFLGGINPMIKLPLELVAGITYWPDPHHPTVIRDRIYHATRLFGLEHEYAVAGKLFGQATPSRGYARGWQEALFNSRPIGEQAYYYIRSTAYTYQRGVLKKEPPAAKGNPYYWAAKKALQWGDQRAYDQAMAKIEAGEDGHTVAGLTKSIRKAAPLAMLYGAEREAFRQTLNANERQLLQRAEEWYNFTMWKKGLLQKP